VLLAADEPLEVSARPSVMVLLAGGFAVVVDSMRPLVDLLKPPASSVAPSRYAMVLTARLGLALIFSERAVDAIAFEETTVVLGFPELVIFSVVEVETVEVVFFSVVSGRREEVVFTSLLFDVASSFSCEAVLVVDFTATDVGLLVYGASLSPDGVLLM